MLSRATSRWIRMTWSWSTWSLVRLSCCCNIFSCRAVCFEGFIFFGCRPLVSVVWAWANTFRPTTKRMNQLNRFIYSRFSFLDNHRTKRFNLSYFKPLSFGGIKEKIPLYMKVVIKMIAVAVVAIGGWAFSRGGTPPGYRFPDANERRESYPFPWHQAGLSERQAAAHLVSRFTYGATPGEVDAVVQMGLENWFARQLEGSLPDDSL